MLAVNKYVIKKLQTARCHESNLGSDCNIHRCFQVEPEGDKTLNQYWRSYT